MSAKRLATFAVLLAWLLAAATANAHLIWNTDDRPVWVTVYRWGAFKNNIVNAECVQPHQRKEIGLGFPGERYVIRGEVTKNANCQQPTECNTTIDFEVKRNVSIWFDFRSNPRNCWWDQFVENKWPPARDYPRSPYVFPLFDPRRPASFYGQVLTAGQSLANGQVLQSTGQMAFATQQADGNLCVYWGTPSRRYEAVWCTNARASGGPFVTAMQADGNLCTYRSSYQGGATWCSGKVAPGGQFFVALGEDANLCVYKGTPSNAQGILWCHDTNVAMGKYNRP
jgi:hypothetical protein